MTTITDTTRLTTTTAHTDVNDHYLDEGIRDAAARGDVAGADWIAIATNNNSTDHHRVDDIDGTNS